MRELSVYGPQHHQEILRRAGDDDVLINTSNQVASTPHVLNGAFA